MARRHDTTIARDAIARCVKAITAADDPATSWELARPLRAAFANPAAAVGLARSLGSFEPSAALALGRELLAAHGDEDAVLTQLGWAFGSLTDLDDLNAAPPTDPWFAAVVARLEARVALAPATETVRLLDALALAARRLGRCGDSIAERAHARMLAIEPDDAHHHYNHGLFLKTRGQFAEGQRANQRAIDLGNDSTAAWWNLGICATGAGDGAAALAAWRHLGQVLELGPSGLPEGRYPMAKLRIAQRPLAERDAACDEPGVQENLWIERVSGCHGIVRSAVFHDELGVEFGDVVMFDGAPIGRDDDKPIFPHLATLRRAGYHVWEFAGTQATSGQLQALSQALPEDAVLYAHTEQVQILCRQCAMGRGGAHTHDRDGADHRVVRGKLCAPPHLTPRTILASLDAAVAANPGTSVLAPSLADDAGDRARGRVEARRLAMLDGSTDDRA